MTGNHGLALAAAAILLTVPTLELEAQAAEPDFFFSPPTLTLTLRAGMMDYQSTGQLFDYTREFYTAEPGDFRGGSVGIEFGLRLAEQLDLTFGVDGGQVTVHHESRDWEEVDGSPIRQSTRVRSGPVGQFGLKAYLMPRGESFGQFAWVPARANLFGSGGLGFSAYEFRQFGDFVDEDRAEIFADDLVSQGSAFVFYAGGGAEASLRRNLALSLEGRYQWARDDLSGDFREFEPINLNGLRLTAGLSVRF